MSVAAKWLTCFLILELLSVVIKRSNVICLKCVWARAAVRQRSYFMIRKRSHFSCCTEQGRHLNYNILTFYWSTRMCLSHSDWEIFPQEASLTHLVLRWRGQKLFTRSYNWFKNTLNANERVAMALFPHMETSMMGKYLFVPHCHSHNDYKVLFWLLLKIKLSMIHFYNPAL